MNENCNREALIEKAYQLGFNYEKNIEGAPSVHWQPSMIHLISRMISARRLSLGHHGSQLNLFWTKICWRQIAI